MEEVFKLAQHGQHLWGKLKARQTRAHLTGIVDGMGRGDVLVIDADGVEAFDLTFAQEFFGKLPALVATDESGRFLVVEHLNDCTIANLGVALERLQLAVIIRTETGLSLLGKLHHSDIETFSACVSGGSSVSAALIGARLDLTPTAANERLAKLTSMGLLRRERGSSASGRTQYEYHVLS